MKPFRNLLNRGLREQTILLWEPCFTHRQFTGLFSRWAEQKDPATGLSRYLSLTRDNRPVHYSEMGQIDAFVVSTYAFGQSALERLYVLPLRAFLRNLAPRFREAPDRFPSLEPDHEHEIAIEKNMTIGDYNPAMVRGFLEYLTNLYGRDLAELNRRMGTPFTEFFDAPRWQGQGAWDEYDESNPFFTAWGNYNRNVVNRRLAQMYTEALLAGFPPEIIKSHQIPDLYGIGDTAQFSQVPTRITPIDYAMAAGIGFGFTRYSCWYKHRTMWPATPMPRATIRWCSVSTSRSRKARRTPSISSASCLNMASRPFTSGTGPLNSTRDSTPRCTRRSGGFSSSITATRMTRGRRPQYRTFQGNGRRFDLAVIGTGPNHTGLIKSLHRDGGLRGTVYVVPFHAHVEITPILAIAARTLNPGEAIATGSLDHCDAGNQFELVFEARTTCRSIAPRQPPAQAPEGTVEIDVCNGDVPLPGLRLYR